MFNYSKYILPAVTNVPFPQLILILSVISPMSFWAMCNYPVCLHFGSNCQSCRSQLVFTVCKFVFVCVRASLHACANQSLANKGMTGKSMQQCKCVSQNMCAFTLSPLRQTERGTLSSLIPLFWVRLELREAFARPAECGFKD